MWWIHSIFLFSVNWTIWPKPFSVLLFQLVQQSKICDHHTSNLKKEYTGKTNIIIKLESLELAGKQLTSITKKSAALPWQWAVLWCAQALPRLLPRDLRSASLRKAWAKNSTKQKEKWQGTNKNSGILLGFDSLSTYNPFELGLMPKKQLGAFSKQTLQFTRGPKPFPIFMNARGHCVLFWVLSGW